jgi:type IV secretion system protein VirB8
MNKQAREALDAYYVEAESWGNDQREALAASRRTAWIVAIAAGAIALMEALALVMLLPLKTVEPYTLLVDRNTGYVQALSPLDPARLSGDTALTQSFLVQYVIAREGYDVDTLQGNYRKVALWSAEQARASYVTAMQISNPQSPLALYPRATVVETRVKSVSPVGRNVALVRFDTQRRDQNGRTEPVRSWVAVIRYHYSGEPMSLEDRLINPLGFQVLRYRRDAEALPAAPEATAPAVTPAVKAPALPAPAQPAPQRPAQPGPEL